MRPTFSVIIPVRKPTAYLKETLSELKKIPPGLAEIIVISDSDVPEPDNPTQQGPAFKRNLAASRAKGTYLAFLDDDSYPGSDWLTNAKKIFENNPSNLAALCGPCLTPPRDNFFRQASGLVWSSLIGSGGAGTYRNSVSSPRYVNDYPSVNLIVKKSVFDKIGGFQTRYWPGEDTLLCRDIITKLKQKIYYHPEILVYHHRRPVLLPHLQQITRYALHRGHFARHYPENSLALGYVLPSLFLIYSLFVFFLLFAGHSSLLRIFSIPGYVYFFLILLTALQYLFSRQNIISILLFIITVPLTHLYYGYLFVIGYFLPQVNLKPHSVDKTGNYLGG